MLPQSVDRSVNMYGPHNDYSANHCGLLVTAATETKFDHHSVAASSLDCVLTDDLEGNDRYFRWLIQKILELTCTLNCWGSGFSFGYLTKRKQTKQTKQKKKDLWLYELVCCQVDETFP